MRNGFFGGVVLGVCLTASAGVAAQLAAGAGAADGLRRLEERQMREKLSTIQNNPQSNPFGPMFRETVLVSARGGTVSLMTVDGTVTCAGEREDLVSWLRQHPTVVDVTFTAR